MSVPDAHGHDDPIDGSATIFTDAIRSKYGDDALPIAEEQLSHATDESVEVWQHVVSRLRG